MGDGPLFSFLILSSYFLLSSSYFLLCAFAPLHLCVFFFPRFFLPAFFSSRVFFFFAAASGATTGAWNFWCIIRPWRFPY